jgi:hypothetical protein
VKRSVCAGYGPGLRVGAYRNYVICLIPVYAIVLEYKPRTVVNPLEALMIIVPEEFLRSDEEVRIISNRPPSTRAVAHTSPYCECRTRATAF